MPHNIKQLKPNKRGLFKQGTINPASCHKLFPSQKNTPIIYRSSWEYKFIYWLETSPQVLEWGSECFPIKYTSWDGKEHTYWPDFVVKSKTGEVVLFEIKPWAQTRPPKNPNNEWDNRTWMTNVCKWKATTELCESKGYQFKIITEKIIDNL